MTSSSPVPHIALETQNLRATQPSYGKDEVAAILRGLALDRSFFLQRVRPTEEAVSRPKRPRNKVLRSMTFTRPKPDDEGSYRSGLETVAVGAFSRPGRPPSLNYAESDDGFSENELSKSTSLANATREINLHQTSDFDIYMTEALAPVLAQALDSLCRQLQRMEEQGDNLDPKARARFNPLTWIAQQLIRLHPKHARTPRRQAIYKNFSDWADFERGRRCMLRKRSLVQTVFKGFALRGGVQRRTLNSVIVAIDDTLRLEGCLKNSVILEQALSITRIESEEPPLVQRTRSDFFSGESVPFDKFWREFTAPILANDIVRFSDFMNGIELMKKEVQSRAQLQEALVKESEMRSIQEEKQRQLVAEYTVVYNKLRTNAQIQGILNQDKILTGDDVRPTDAGYDIEAEPHGEHCTLLRELLVLLGFDSLPTLEDADLDTSVIDGWWVDELADAWMMLQQMEGCEFIDGVVEKGLLSKILVDPDDFVALKERVSEWRDEQTEAQTGVLASLLKDTTDDLPVAMRTKSSRQAKGKPSMDELCSTLGLTKPRLMWLHQLFKVYLQTEGDGKLTCRYPDAPGSISKQTFHQLLLDLKPNMLEAEFEAKFKRIDLDGSQSVEFDEFAALVADGEIRVVGQTDRKLGYEELADLHGVDVECIKYFHHCFEDALPEGVRDGYPDDPAYMTAEQMQELCSILGIFVSAAEFRSQFELVDIGSQGDLCFDEFLEVINIGTLPKELTGPSRR